jgi:hypothetical protein
MTWDRYKKAFEPDGSLRDIYIADATTGDWNLTLRFLRSRYTVSFEQNGSESKVPDSVHGLFTTASAESDPVFSLLRIDVEGIAVNMHFFAEEVIEFDLDPDDINSAGRLASLFAFMSSLAAELSKEIILTPESCSEEPIFRCLPGSAPVEVLAPGGK